MFNSGYNNFLPYQSIGAKQGLFSAFKGKFNWSSLLNNTQKTLNIINQAIPVFYQVKPIWNNTKTIFKIMGAIRDDDNKTKVSTRKNTSSRRTNNITTVENTSNNKLINDNTPNFFL